ncbi:MAG: hypothetical protein KDK26_04465 [Roseivivax sp.]|nr:hypothetical protein [Roseivivax sp.]
MIDAPTMAAAQHIRPATLGNPSPLDRPRNAAYKRAMMLRTAIIIRITCPAL